MHTRKVLITGSNGFIGFGFREYLLSKGLSIIEYNEDITKPIVLDEKIDLIYHLAAKTSVQDSLRDPFLTMQTNFLGTFNVLEFAKKNAAKVIFPSAAGVYERSNSFYANETDSLNPKNPYVESKYLSEQLCDYYSKNYNVQSIALRIFNVYGGRQTGGFLIPTLINGALKDTKIELNSPHSVRDYIYIKDVYEVLFKALDYVPKTGFEIFNVGTGVGISVGEMVSYISNILDKHLEVVYTNFRKNEIDKIIADITKIKNAFNWNPSFNINQGLIATIKEFNKF